MAGERQARIRVAAHHGPHRQPAIWAASRGSAREKRQRCRMAELACAANPRSGWPPADRAQAHAVGRGEGRAWV